MNRFVEGGPEAYLRELRAGHRGVVAQLRARHKAAKTLAECEEIEQTLVEAKREHAEQLRVAQQAIFLGS